MGSESLAHLAPNANPAGERACPQFISARWEDPPLSSQALPLELPHVDPSLCSQTQKCRCPAVCLSHRTRAQKSPKA